MSVLVAGRWFSPGTPVYSTNKTDRHDITEILLKVELNTISPANGMAITECLYVIDYISACFDQQTKKMKSEHFRYIYIYMEM